MDKRGAGEGPVVFIIIELAAALILIGGLVYAIGLVDARIYEEKHIARDFALLYETLQVSNHPIRVDYTLLKPEYKLLITKEEETYYVNVANHTESLAQSYPLITPQEFIPPEETYGVEGLQTITLYGYGGSISIGESYDIGEAPPVVTEDQGTFVYPVAITDRTITECFGVRGDDVHTEPPALFCTRHTHHCGVDIRAPNQEPALAATDGTITAVLFGPDNFGTIRLKPRNQENMELAYMHLSSSNVAVGDTVRKGQIIGNTGSTVSRGYQAKNGPIDPHLHLEMIVDGKKVDPLATGLFDLGVVNFKAGSNCIINQERYAYRNDIQRSRAS